MIYFIAGVLTTIVVICIGYCIYIGVNAAIAVKKLKNPKPRLKDGWQISSYKVCHDLENRRLGENIKNNIQCIKIIKMRRLQDGIG